MRNTLPWIQAPPPKYQQAPMNLAVGVFDGIHRGHRKLMDTLMKNGGDRAVLSFQPNPARLFNPEKYPGDILSQRLKERTLRQLGIGQLFTIDFSKDFSKLGGRDFLAFLESSLRIRRLVVGEDFRVGRGREIDFPGLVQWGRERGIEVEQAPSVCDGRGRISSTRIRNAVATGDLAAVSNMLGYPFPLDLREGSCQRGEDGLYRVHPDRQSGLIALPPGRYLGGLQQDNRESAFPLEVQRGGDVTLKQGYPNPVRDGEDIIYVYEQIDE